jgi:hypothetical protein
VQLQYQNAPAGWARLNWCGWERGSVAQHTAGLPHPSDAPAHAQAWKAGRVFFCTPQVVSNDLKTGRFPGDEVVALVLDECHRAQGGERPAASDGRDILQLENSDMTAGSYRSVVPPADSQDRHASCCKHSRRFTQSLSC